MTHMMVMMMITLFPQKIENCHTYRYMLYSDSISNRLCKKLVNLHLYKQISRVLCFSPRFYFILFFPSFTVYLALRCENDISTRRFKMNSILRLYIRLII